MKVSGNLKRFFEKCGSKIEEAIITYENGKIKFLGNDALKNVLVRGVYEVEDVDFKKLAFYEFSKFLRVLKTFNEPVVGVKDGRLVIKEDKKTFTMGVANEEVIDVIKDEQLNIPKYDIKIVISNELLKDFYNFYKLTNAQDLILRIKNKVLYFVAGVDDNVEYRTDIQVESEDFDIVVNANLFLDFTLSLDDDFILSIEKDNLLFIEAKNDKSEINIFIAPQVE